MSEIRRYQNGASPGEKKINFHSRICLLTLENEGERETLTSCLRYAPRAGIQPTTEGCTLTWIQTHKLLVCGTTLPSTEPPCQVLEKFYISKRNISYFQKFKTFYSL